MSGGIALAGLVAFALGSIPFSYLLGRWRGIDLRTRGSGNVGATNLARTAGWGAGAAGLLLDALKGSAAVLLAPLLAGGGATAQSVAALGAILGHNFSPFLRFRGGKGVATGAGAFAVLAPGALGTAAAVFAVALALGRMVSLGSILAALTLPIAGWARHDPPGVVLSAAICGALIIVRHRGNIVRMARGDENRVWGKR